MATAEPVGAAPLRSPEPSGPDAVEAALLARLRAGDEAAFEELVRTQTGRLLAVTRRLLRDDAEAQDAVQTAFLNAFRTLASFQGHCKISTWLHRIAVNVALGRIRRRTVKREVDLEPLLPVFDEGGHHVAWLEDWSMQAETELLRSELMQHVLAAIDQLPPTYREVLQLRDFDELSTDEVAEALGITANAVKIRLHRARLAIRQQIGPFFASRRPGAR